MRIAVITTGFRLLIAAVFCLLLAFPAAAHPGHDHGASPLIAVAALDALIDQPSSCEPGKGQQVIAAPAWTSLTSTCCCCCGQSGCCTGSACKGAMACGSGSCGHGGALVLLPAARGTPPAKSVGAAPSDQLLAGNTLGPADRPPRA